MVGLFEIERANNLLHVRTKIIYLNIETEPLPWAMNRDTNRTVGPLYRCIPTGYGRILNRRCKEIECSDLVDFIFYISCYIWFQSKRIVYFGTTSCP